MGKAIIAGAIKAKAVKADEVWIRNSNYTSSYEVAQKLGVKTADSIQDLADKVDIIILGTKPAMISTVLAGINQLDLQSKLFISIAAGVTLHAMEGYLGGEHKIIRTMPNTPTLVGEGVIAYTPNALCEERDLENLISLLESSATLTKIPEPLMNAITGLSGSGPAYVYTFIEALADGAVKEGLPRAQALELAAKTVLGGAKMVLDSGIHPALLRDQVTSPGGTTIAAIASLEENGFRNATIKAVETAAKRSRELS